jgi:predicted NACHT family NTPase
MDADALLPLLDALDEVARERRAACMEAINAYWQEEQGLLPLAVCSRVVDYDELTVKLRLLGAVRVHRLPNNRLAIIWRGSTCPSDLSSGL